MQRTEHFNRRPGWDCCTCGLPWPCVSAKADLVREFQKFPSVLAIYMSAQMQDALNDLTDNGDPAPLDLYERFLAWVIDMRASM
jgi:hypothetical protein